MREEDLTVKRQQVVVTKQMFNELVEKGPNDLRLYVNPVLYVERAIECLTTQLSTAKGKARRLKLTNRINDWKSELVILKQTIEKAKDEEQKDSIEVTENSEGVQEVPGSQDDRKAS